MFRPTALVDAEHPKDLTKDKPTSFQEERTFRRSLANDKLIAWLVADIMALGFKGKDLRRLDPSNSEAHDFAENPFILTCGDGKPAADGRVYEDWRVVRDQDAPLRASKDQVQAAFDAIGEVFSAKMEKRLESETQPSKEEDLENKEPTF